MNNKQASLKNADVDRFDHWATTYEQSFMQKIFFGPVHTRMIALLLQARQANPPACIVDVGCGTGRLLRRLQLSWPKANLIGIDPAEQMLARAISLNPSATFKLGSGEAIPLPDQSADIVTSSISFHHWVDHQKGVLEIARILRPGGIFCLADHEISFSQIFGERMKTRKEINALMKHAGLNILQQHKLGALFVLITLAQK